jgi:hypothetical protein
MNWRVLLFATFAATAAPVDAAPPVDATITVTGTKVDRKEVHHKITAFLRRVAVVPEAGQYARRNVGYCPAVVGIDPAYATRVTNQVVAAGRAAGLADPRPRCSPNLTIIFTPDADYLMRLIRKRRPQLLTEWGAARTKELFDNGRPIRWWYAIGKSLPGGESIGDSVAGGPAGTEGGLSGMSGGNTARVYSASLIETNIKVDLDGTYVVIDVNKATGFSLDSVASYAAMVSFAQIKGYQDFAGFPSILALFSPDQDKATAPAGLTDWDKAYLRGLYRVPPNRDVTIQRTRLAGEMMRAMAPTP